MITLREIFILLFILALASMFVPAWRPYRAYSGIASALFFVLVVLVLLKVLD
jgi:hypothetical protein